VAEQQHLRILAKNGVTPMAKTFLSIPFTDVKKDTPGITKSGK
jgi:hypothetical protein